MEAGRRGVRGEEEGMGRKRKRLIDQERARERKKLDMERYGCKGEGRTGQDRTGQQNRTGQCVPSTTLKGALVRSCRAIKYITVATARSPPECLEPERSTIPLS